MVKKKENPSKWDYEDRRNDIKNQIRNVGISRLPSQTELSNKYGVCRSQVCQDIQKIVTELDPRELDEVFTDFYQSDLKALEMLKDIMKDGSNADKIKAVNALISLQKGATDLLEAFSKKSKVADKLEVAGVSYNFTMKSPVKSEESEEIIYDIVPGEKPEKK